MNPEEVTQILKPMFGEPYELEQAKFEQIGYMRAYPNEEILYGGYCKIKFITLIFFNKKLFSIELLLVGYNCSYESNVEFILKTYNADKIEKSKWLVGRNSKVLFSNGQISLIPDLMGSVEYIDIKLNQEAEDYKENYDQIKKEKLEQKSKEEL